MTRAVINRLRRAHETWVALAILSLTLVMSFVTPTFTSGDNLYNTARNLSYIALIALGQTAVIISGGVDLSVGSIVGLVGIITSIVLESGHSLGVAFAAAVVVSVLCGFVNGALIAYLRLPSFVVTLATLSIFRSLCLVVAANKMIYQFGPDEERFLALGGGDLAGIPNPVLIALAACLVVGFLFSATRWGRHLYAMGGSENAAQLCGLPIERLKISAFVLCGLLSGLAGFLWVGWLGSVTSSLATGTELTVVAAAVIGGANLTGGYGSAFGALLGATLVEVIRNALLLAGVDPYWQGTFVGAFIIFAVILEKLREKE